MWFLNSSSMLRRLVSSDPNAFSGSAMPHILPSYSSDCKLLQISCRLCSGNRLVSTWLSPISLPCYCMQGLWYLPSSYPALVLFSDILYMIVYSLPLGPCRVFHVYLVRLFGPIADWEEVIPSGILPLLR